MNNNHSSPHRNRMVVAVICSLLFLSFSFVYLYVQHGEVMRFLFEDVLLDGTFAYSPLWGALGITLALWLLQGLLGRVSKFGRICLAVPYFPAYWALAFLTSVYPMEENGTFSLGWGENWWWFPCVLLVYFVWGCIFRGRFTSKGKRGIVEMLIPNLLVLILFSYAVGFIGNNNELFHNQMRVSQYIRSHRYEDALAVGKKSLHNTHSLTALRAWALAHTGALGESLFEYPQSNRADGLFFQENGGEICMFTNKDVEQFLGTAPRNPDESALLYLQRICPDSVDNRRALDYYLCALLLEKKLEEFHQVLSERWLMDTPLPRHYQEAVLLFLRRTAVESPLERLCTSSAKERHDAFFQLQAEHTLPLHQNNYTRRKFGDTYWWYYYYGG